MYLTLHKTDFLPDLQVTISVPLDSEDHTTFSVDTLNLINGDYKIQLIGHSGSGQTKIWQLGTVKVWFKDGQSETTNNFL